MLAKLLQNADFSKIYADKAHDVINFLISQKSDFGILCNIETISFDPPLPPDIKASLKPLTLFILSNYTLESAYISNGTLYFEAGFGSGDFGSLVGVSLGGIIQIAIDDTVIFINLSASLQAKTKNSKQGSIELSKNAFSANVKN
ncbi:MAG: hypothetical protein ACTTIC_07165 [Helicobacteraceae bacterium]